MSRTAQGPADGPGRRGEYVAGVLGAGWRNGFARQREERDVLRGPSESERATILAFQIEDARDTDGAIWVYDLTRRQYRTVDAAEALRLCLDGKASLHEPRLTAREQGTGG